MMILRFREKTENFGYYGYGVQDLKRLLAKLKNKELSKTTLTIYSDDEESNLTEGEEIILKN